MAKTGTQLVALFRSLSGENALTPTATQILDSINLARGGDESPLLELYPMLSSEMGTLADPVYITLAADTTRYSFAAGYIPVKISKVWVKYAADDDYYPVEYLVHQRIEDGSPMARRGGGQPIIGIYNNGFDLFPEPSQAVTQGVRFDCLILPADMTTGNSTVESNRIASVIVKRAIQIFYRAMKRFDEANYWEAETTKGMARLLSNQPASIPEKPTPRGRGSLTRHMRNW